MTATFRSSVSEAPRYTGNVFLLVERIFSKSMEATNDGMEARYLEEDLINKQYQTQLDKWKTDADALPTAGATTKPESKTLNDKGRSVAVGLGAAAVALFAIGAALACTVVLGPIGLALLALAGVLAGVAAGLTAAIAIKPDAISGSFADTIPEHNEYDPGAQGKQNSLVQQDQSNIQLLQSYLGKIMQQYISPANDTKSQDANMIQGAIQWIKSMMWTQGAA